MTRTLALTLDVDGPGEYARLHGLTLPARLDPLLMYRAPLARFLSLCEAAAAGGRHGTLFVVGRDVAAGAASPLREAAQRGVEVASHSQTHDYELSRRVPTQLECELRESRDVIANAVGSAPRGFRAPGYHLSRALLDAVEAAGYAYDSSVMPSPPYYAAKALVLAWYRLRRRTSASLLGSPIATLAPRTPYRPAHAEPYRRGSRALVELPIAVATIAGLPVTGASLVLAPAPLRRLLVTSLAAQETLVLNLHAMDLVDPARDGLPEELASRQPELRMDVKERLAVLTEVIGTLAAGRKLVTCAELVLTAAHTSR